MIFLKLFKPLISCLGTILLVLIAACLFDILLAVISSRFYSNAAFIVIFGVAGIFATILGFSIGMEQAAEKNETTRWSLLILAILAGLLVFFFLAAIEGGEYGPGFKAFGVMTSLSSLLFIKGNLHKRLF